MMKGIERSVTAVSDVRATFSAGRPFERKGW
jgi:hypothetical protein